MNSDFWSYFTCENISFFIYYYHLLKNFKKEKEFTCSSSNFPALQEKTIAKSFFRENPDNPENQTKQRAVQWHSSHPHKSVVFQPQKALSFQFLKLPFFASDSFLFSLFICLLLSFPLIRLRSEAKQGIFVSPCQLSQNSLTFQHHSSFSEYPNTISAKRSWPFLLRSDFLLTSRLKVWAILAIPQRHGSSYPYLRFPSSELSVPVLSVSPAHISIITNTIASPD